MAVPRRLVDIFFRCYQIQPSIPMWCMQHRHASSQIVSSLRNPTADTGIRWSERSERRSCSFLSRLIFFPMCVGGSQTDFEAAYQVPAGDFRETVFVDNGYVVCRQTSCPMVASLQEPPGGGARYDELCTPAAAEKRGKNSSLGH